MTNSSVADRLFSIEAARLAAGVPERIAQRTAMCPLAHTGFDIATLAASIRREGVKAIFLESSLPPDLGDALANDAGVTIVEGDDSLYGDTLGPPGSDGDTYLKMIRHTTATIVGNLK